ncbi:MAG: cupredoxin domain-containing protein [Thermaerobacterales bacterium]
MEGRSARRWLRPGRLLALALILFATPMLLTGCPFGRQQGQAVEERVVMGEYFFEPDSITVPADSELTLVIPNEGTLEHNFMLEEMGVDQDVPAGEERTVTFTANQAGTFTFFCNVPGHKELGQAGTLHVE